MTIDDMRAALGLGPELSDVDVTELYAAFLASSAGFPLGEEPITLAEARQQLGMLPDDPDDQDDFERLDDELDHNHVFDELWVYE